MWVSYICKATLKYPPFCDIKLEWNSWEVNSSPVLFLSLHRTDLLGWTAKGSFKINYLVFLAHLKNYQHLQIKAGVRPCIPMNSKLKTLLSKPPWFNTLYAFDNSNYHADLKPEILESMYVYIHLDFLICSFSLKNSQEWWLLFSSSNS